MPKEGQTYAPRMTLKEAKEEFGQAEVEAVVVGRADNRKARGLSSAEIVALYRRALAAARASQQSGDPTLTAPEAPMTEQDHRAWMVFIELLKHHEAGRQLRKWNAVRDVLLDFEDAATAQEQPRQSPGGRPAISVAKAAP